MRSSSVERYGSDFGAHPDLGRLMERSLFLVVLLMTVHCPLFTTRGAWAAPLSDVDTHLTIQPIPVLPWGRDPFSEKDTGPKTSGGKPGAVSAIFLNQKDAKRSFAIVEGKVLRMGDRLGDKRVVEITATKIVLSNEEQVTELKLGVEGEDSTEKDRFSLRRADAAELKSDKEIETGN